MVENNIFEEYKIDNVKKYNIVAIVDNSDWGETALKYGLIFSNIFKANLSIIYENNEKKFQNQSDNYLKELKIENDIKIDFLKIDVKNKKQVSKFIEQSNSILFVVGATKEKNYTLFTYKKLLKYIKNFRIPTVVCGKELYTNFDFKNILLSVDSLRPAKEKSLWAGYFSRFYNSTIHIITSNQKNKYFSNRLEHSLKFIKKLYSNLDVNYHIHNIDYIETQIDKKSIETIKLYEASIYVINLTKHYTIFDYIFGVQELELFNIAENIPIMCLNQKDDLYVLCT